MNCLGLHAVALATADAFARASVDQQRFGLATMPRHDLDDTPAQKGATTTSKVIAKTASLGDGGEVHAAIAAMQTQHSGTAGRLAT